MEATKNHTHSIPYRTYVIVWLVLLALTAILVLASAVSRSLAVWAMLFLTPVKAGLVFFFFMHLKYEKTFLKALVFMTLGLLVMVIALFFLDISYR
ncbi:MAG: cytochrome C oxidase subunit IV family protein [Acidobacteria bacterium]|nr:cytochrome C oxidase subunit IV family protein [Acidobacteriota bacterium]